MGFAVIQPPADEQQLSEAGKEIVVAAAGFGLVLDTEGFLMSWISGTRVMVERDDDDGTITSLALVAVGKRWMHRDFTASALALHGNREAMLEFVKTICNALGATALYVEEPEPLDEQPGVTRYVVQKIQLQ